MTTTQHIFRSLVTCLLLIVVVGCSATATQPSPVPESSAPAGAASPIPLVLFLWHSWSGPEQTALVRLVEAYNRSHPEVQIILQARPAASLVQDAGAAMAEGSGPQLVLLQNHTLGTLVEDNLLLPLNGLVSPDEQAQLLPAAVGGATIQSADGATLYGLPIAFDTLALFYNKANLLVPPDTTDTLLRSARGLTDTTTDPPIWGLAYNLSLTKTIGYLYAFGGRVFDEDGDVVLGLDGRDGTERWLQWLIELRQDQRILAGLDGITIDSALMTQEALMTIDWAHALPNYQNLWADNAGVATLPRLSSTNNPPEPYVQSDLLCVNARLTAGAEQAAALDFVRYMVSEDAQQTLLDAGKQPTRLALDIDGDTPTLEAARVFREQASTGQPMPNTPIANTVVWTILDDMQSNAVRGLTSVEQSVSQADAALRQQIEPTTTP